MSYGKFLAAIISVAEYDSEGVGYSTVMADFPFVPGSDVPYDTLTDLRKPWGRHPVTKLPLFVYEVDRFLGTIDTDGVNSLGDFATPTKGTIPAACIVIAQVTAASVLLAIDNHAKHFVLGVEGPDLNGDDLPAGLLPYEFDTPIPSGRWTTLRNGLVALGLDAEAVDGWKTNHPDATPRDFGEALRNFTS